VFGHTQLPSQSMDAPAKRSIAKEEERIEAVFFERVREGSELPLAKKNIPPQARDRWNPGPNRKSEFPFPYCRTEEGEFIAPAGGSQSLIWLSRGDYSRVVSGPGAPKELLRSTDGGKTWKRQPMNLPSGFRGSATAIARLSSGRLLVALNEWLLSAWGTGKMKKIIEQRGGYYIWTPDTASYDYCRLTIIYSDDDGKTWQGTDKHVDFSPLQWAQTNVPFVEQADGTVVIPIWGCLNEKDGRERLDANGLLRSTDGGKTWGDFSLIAYDKEERWTAYNEAVLVPVEDDLWVTFLRTEYRGVGNEGGWTSRTVSTDGGYTWSEPELTTLGGAFGAEILPDGGIVLGHSGGIHFTYDLGRTWTRLAPCAGYGCPILVDDNTLMVGNQQTWGEFGTWFRVPAGK